MDSDATLIDALMMQAQITANGDVDDWTVRLGPSEHWTDGDGWDHRRAWALWLTFLGDFSEHRMEHAEGAMDALQAETQGRDREDWGLLISTSRRAMSTGDAVVGPMDSLVLDLVRIEELSTDLPTGLDPRVLAYALNGAIITMMRSMLHGPARVWQRKLRRLADLAGSERLHGVSLMNEAESVLDLAFAAAAEGRDQAHVRAMIRDARSMFEAGADRLAAIGLIEPEHIKMLRYGLAIRAIDEPTAHNLARAQDEALSLASRGNWEVASTLVAGLLMGSTAVGDDALRDRARVLSGQVFAATPRVSGALTYLLEHLATRFDPAGSELQRSAAEASRLGVRIRLDAARRAAGSFDTQCDVARTVVRAQRTAGLAMRDPLTGVGNRRALHERLSAAIEYCAVDGRPTVVAYLDLDDFKMVNDRFSHQGGDAVLTAFVASLESRFAAPDSLYRYGGDEFVLVLDGLTVDRGLEIVAAALHAVGVDSTDLIAGGISATVGVTAVLPADDVESVLHRADLALLRAKRFGKGSVVSADHAEPANHQAPTGHHAPVDRCGLRDTPRSTGLWTPPPLGEVRPP